MSCTLTSWPKENLLGHKTRVHYQEAQLSHPHPFVSQLKTEKHPCYNLSESLLNLVTPIVTSTVIYREPEARLCHVFAPLLHGMCSFTNNTLCCGIITEYYHRNTMLQSGVVFPVSCSPFLLFSVSPVWQLAWEGSSTRPATSAPLTHLLLGHLIFSHTPSLGMIHPRVSFGNWQLYDRCV